MPGVSLGLWMGAAMASANEHGEHGVARPRDPCPISGAISEPGAQPPKELSRSEWSEFNQLVEEVSQFGHQALRWLEQPRSGAVVDHDLWRLHGSRSQRPGAEEG